MKKFTGASVLFFVFFSASVLFLFLPKENSFKEWGGEEAAVYNIAAQDLAKGLCPRLELTEETYVSFEKIFAQGGEVNENWLADFSQLVKKFSGGKVRIEAPCRGDLDVPGIYFTLCFGDMAQGVQFTPEQPFFKFQYQVIALQAR
ncbi:hypothetical protein A3I35_03820 [Candidatus Falkowbacteria bacterium RIFCSPLOWO2_02_FULL_45_15]|uniref:Uncharacterized protein n=2 Tax=Candidatus Falkowiibacteriota TaxID=1752728 RepID=A0A1F5RVH3_9BACT|nr:MAG: hypothetical protein A3D54_00395 [Candidatus Falkowbacteria bacterium RIFCSPHIGHO2_02_FULL_45_15]OGF19218.1 MAG: hypothetical protein A3I35_03820 [Candidatus Falkowbacteria bacterium RIFCSPLOWO2_02_FULL_45_15]